MSNSFFHFKQFAIHQEHCAMKVCTDACLFGAWMVHAIKKYGFEFENALDIGAGTGLLSLMLAQENRFSIDAIEINESAALQAQQNISASPWGEQIHIYNQSLQEFVSQKKYDFIFSNPPFFENDLLSPSKTRNAAMHDESLTLEELIEFIKNNLNQKGYASVLIPFHRTFYLESLLSKSDLFVVEKWQVRQTVRHSNFRTMIFFSNFKSRDGVSENEISIHDENRNYTPEFVSLLKGYYLKL